LLKKIQIIAYDFKEFEAHICHLNSGVSDCNAWLLRGATRHGEGGNVYERQIQQHPNVYH
jgi:hypothetical protein